MKFFFILFLLLLLNGCKRITIDREYEALKEKAFEQTNKTINWQDLHQKKITTLNKQPESLVLPSPIVRQSKSISRQQAIGYALENNYELQTAFEDLGIAKSDLVQAGLFTNPFAELLVKFPVFDLFPFEEGLLNRHPKMDFEAMMQLADFWQVPIKKKVAHDDLEIITFTILHLIIEITVHTKFAYDTCVYMQARLFLLENIYKQLVRLQERIYYRQGFGFERDLDRYLIDIRIAQWQTMIIEQKAKLRAAFADLRTLMGVSISSEGFNFCDELNYNEQAIPPVNTLEQIGLQYRPPLQIKQIQIVKAAHELTLQKRKIFNDVKFGIAYERDLIEGQGVGPGLHMDLPFFDPNYAQIAKARFELKKAKKAFKAEKRQLLEQIYQGYEHIEGLQDEIEVYKTSIIPPSECAIEYAEKFFNRMQLNMTILLESHITWYEMHEKLLEKKYEMAKMYAHLEKAIGKIITC